MSQSKYLSRVRKLEEIFLERKSGWGSITANLTDIVGFWCFPTREESLERQIFLLEVAKLPIECRPHALISWIMAHDPDWWKGNRTIPGWGPEDRKKGPIFPSDESAKKDDKQL